MTNPDNMILLVVLFVDDDDEDVGGLFVSNLVSLLSKSLGLICISVSYWFIVNLSCTEYSLLVANC